MKEEMKIELSHKKEENLPTNSKEKYGNFEETKENFASWVDFYLDNLYLCGVNEVGNDGFFDPAESKIRSLLGIKYSMKITPEMKDLTVIFGEKVISFCKMVIFKNEFNENKIKIFYNNLYKTFFGKSPTIFENLNIDFLQKILISSEINETYGLRNIVDISGEMSYDLSFNSRGLMDQIINDIKTIPKSQKISVIKQLASSARRAISEGSWAYPAYKNIIFLLQKERQTENSPIVSFIIDLELKKTKNYAYNLGEFEEEDSFREYNEEVLFEDLNKIDTQSISENNDFLKNHRIIPSLENVRYSKVSKDYGSIVLSNNLVPIALVKIPEINKIKENITDFLPKDIENLKLFLAELDNNKVKDNQFYVDVSSIPPYLNKKGIEEFDLLSIGSKEVLENLNKNLKELEDVLKMMKEYKIDIISEVEKDNFNKTKELFNYVEENFTEIFTGFLRDEGYSWINFRNDNYSEGLFEVVRNISLLYSNYGDKLGEKEKIQAKLISDLFQNLKKYHGDNFTLAQQKIDQFNEKSWKEYDEKILQTIEIAKKINLTELKIIIQNIIKREESVIEPLPIKNYDRFTKDKKFNPLGEDDFSHLVKIFHSPETRSYINNRLKIKVENLFLREQIYFLRFLSDSDENKFNILESILENQNETEKMNFLRSFLSISGDSSMGDKILVLGQKFPEDVAGKVFAKYGELIDNVDKISDTLAQKLSNQDNFSPETVMEVKNNFLMRAKNLLEKYADSDGKDFENIIQALENIKAENVLILSIFQSLRDTNGIKFEDLKDFDFKGKHYPLSEEQKEMEIIIKKNYKDAPMEAQDAILESFKKAIDEKNEDINFPTLKYKNKVASFMQLNYAKYKGTKDYGKKVYFGSFNVDPDFANGEVGSAMIERNIDEISRTHIVEADCNAEQNIGAKYIESGFVATEFYDFKGLPGFKIIRDDKLNNDSIGKKLSKEEIISNATNGFYDNGSNKLQIITATSQKELLPYFSMVLNGDKIVSRYFYDKNNKKWIAVVEENIFSKDLE